MSQHSHGHGHVVRNIIGLLINQLGTWTVTLVMTFVVPPYLGVQIYGLFAFVGTYTGFFALGISLGIGTYLTWRIAREPKQASRLTLNTLLMQIPLGLLWGVIGIVVFTRLDNRLIATELVGVMMIGTVLSALSSTCMSALNGLQIMRTPAFMTLGISAIATALIVVVIQLHQSVVVIAVCGLSVQAAGTLIMLAYTQRKLGLRSQIELRLWPKLVAGGLPFFMWSVVLLFYWQVDIIQLKAMVGDTVVGWYAVANRIIGIPVFLPNIVVTAILPALSRERTAESPTFRAITSRALRLVVLVNVPACVGTVMLATGFVGLLHYPSTFDQISPLIVILAVNMPLVALDMVLGTVLISLGKQKSWTVVGIVACVANPLVNLWAIPFTQHFYGNGAIGASFTSILSEVIMFVGALILRPRGVFTRWDVWYMFRCLLAASIMVPAVWGLSTRAGVGILPAVCYGVLVYALAAYALQVVRNEDFKALAGAVGARVGAGGTTRLDWETLREQLGIEGRVAAARVRLARVGGAISRPLGVVSRPLARAGRAVSQPLAQVKDDVTQAVREQYHASPVSEYVRKAGEIFSQEAIPDGTGPALEAVTPETLHAFERSSSVFADQVAVDEHAGMAERAEQASSSPLPAGDEQDERVSTGQHRVPLRSNGHKDPKTMQRGETEPLPSLEEAQSRGTPGAGRSIFATGFVQE